MDYTTIAAIYAGGVFFWCFLMSVMGERVDGAYFLSALIWPTMALHMAGVIIRIAIKRVRP